MTDEAAHHRLPITRTCYDYALIMDVMMRQLCQESQQLIRGAAQMMYREGPIAIACPVCKYLCRGDEATLLYDCLNCQTQFMILSLPEVEENTPLEPCSLSVDLDTIETPS